MYARPLLIGWSTWNYRLHKIAQIIGHHLFHRVIFPGLRRFCRYVLTCPVLYLALTARSFFLCVCVRAFTVAMSYQLYNFLSMVRRARRPQIRVIPLATRLVIFMLYLFIALVYVSRLCDYIPRIVESLLMIFRSTFRTSLWSIKDRHTFIRDIYTSTCA
jgi:hypothetical protein